MRRPLVIGNWKMHGNTAGNAVLVEALLPLSVSAEVVLCAPHVYIEQMRQLLLASSIVYGAQDASLYHSGAYTGEVSAAMLADLGCRYVIVGHSERRQYHGETSAQVAQKVAAVQAAGLVPILCVGESLAQRNTEQTLQVIGRQLQAVLDVLDPSALANLVVAYEPIWAVGTGLTPTPEEAQAVHRFIRNTLGATADAIRIIYGGSLSSANAAALFAQPDIDGGLVGGAALVADEFAKIMAVA
ncbi:MAG: triose-phosphate isomerase [Cellvibrionaceae bacterium]|nr:triose-phosphate isomerase [Cellvibrionaceae bacterium]